MKRLIVSFIGLICLVGNGWCGLFDNLTASTFFNLKNEARICYGGTTSLVEKYDISLDLGIITDAQKLAYGVGIGIDIGELIKKWPGWNINDVFKQGKLGAFIAKTQWESRTIDMAGFYIGTRIDFTSK